MKEVIYNHDQRGFIGSKVVLTLTESKIFNLLWETDGYVSKEAIMEAIWGKFSDKVHLSMRVNIAYLRKRIKPLGLVIVNKSQLGYKVESK